MTNSLADVKFYSQIKNNFFNKKVNRKEKRRHFFKTQKYGQPLYELYLEN